MPIYEYECQRCGHRLEAIQKLNEAPLTDCPRCAQAALRRLVSAAAFRLKGGGWYETDFKKEKQRNVAKSDTETPAKSSEGGAKDTKPASDSKPKTDTKANAAG